MIDLALIWNLEKETGNIPVFPNGLYPYRQKNIVSTTNVSWAYSEIPHYPHLQVEHENWLVLLEGAVYNQTRQTLFQIAKQLADTADKGEVLPLIRKTQEDLDGEYNFYLLKKEDGIVTRFIFFSDLLARLQVFFIQREKQFVLARNMHQLSTLIKNKTPNPFFVADTLSFGFALDNSTMFAEVKTSSEAQVIDIKIRGNHFHFFQQHLEHDLSYQSRFNDKNQYVEHVLPILKKSTADRLNYQGQHPYVCDITGGFDSRTVFGLLHQEKNAIFETNLVLGDEEKIARSLFRHFNMEKKLVSIPYQPMEKNTALDQLIHYLQPFSGDRFSNTLCWFALEEMKKMFAVNYRIGGIGFTDFIRKGIRVDHRSVAETFMRKNPYGPTIGETARILGLHINDYLQHIDKTVNAWPEKSHDDQLKRFFYLRTLILQSRLSEDRERFHYWTIHPLWNHRLCLDTLRHFPLKWRGYHIHYLLLKAIDHRLVEVPTNKTYVNMHNERSLRSMDRKDNSRYYRQLKSALLGIRKKKHQQKHNQVINGDLHTYLAGNISQENLPPVLEYMRDTYRLFAR